MDGDNPTNEDSHIPHTSQDGEEGAHDSEVDDNAASSADSASPPPGGRLCDRRQHTTNISQLCPTDIGGEDRGVTESNATQDENPLGTRPKIRRSSGVRGITIEGNSRDNSPHRLSPYRSPGGSPRYPNDRPFHLPSSPRMTNSMSDNFFQSVDGARPKSAPKPPPTSVSMDNIVPGSRRHSVTPERNRHRNRNRLMLTSESLPEDPRSREVVEQSEEVMQNYMFERYNRDRHLGNVPESPTILENFTQRPQTNVSALGRRLAAIGDEIDAKYSTEFQYMTHSLNISQGASEEAYEAFKGVAMKLFRSGLSLGRIVALLQFGYHLAIDVLRQGVGDFMSNIVSWLVRFIAVEKFTNVVSQTTQSIAEWIAGQGGWRGAVEMVNHTILTESAPAIAGYAVACAALVAVVFWLRQQ